jgi:gamma-butyrobetaine dioxygenase
VSHAYDALSRLFADEGDGEYLGEAVTVAQHMLQTGAAARAAGATRSLVVAAVVHDVGHFTGVVSGRDLMAGTDNHHDEAAATWLSQWFGPAVTEPVRLHVAAKRYLCAAEPGYFGLLSPESVRTLALQGGPMTPEQAAAFESLPYAPDAVAVRRWDDEAKDPAVTPPEFGHFQALLRALLGQGPLSS